MARDVTLKDIAREANLSVAAVSKALAGYPNISEATRQRVRSISEQLNYKPRRRRNGGSDGRLGRRGPQHIGLMLVEVDEMAPYLNRWLPGLTQAARESGLRLELGHLSLDADDWRDHLQHHTERQDGLVLFGCIRTTLLEAAGQLGLPWVVVGDIDPEAAEAARSVHQVNTDKQEMGRFATQTLLHAGHTRIGCFRCNAPVGGWIDQWYSGYRLALMRAEVGDEPALRPELESTSLYEEGAVAAEYMAGLDDPPTAYVIPTVRAAARFREAMAERGIEVGPDRLIVGGSFDQAADHGLRNYPLITENVSGMAQRAIDLLVRLAEGEPLWPAQIQLPYLLHNFPVSNDLELHAPTHAASA
ncbi:MAG: LacI family DNA-binding transcriptional regulator [Phycisphaeraceae bacterium]